MSRFSTPEHIKAIYTLLGQNHLRDEKENIVSAFTGGRTNSVRKMYYAEAAALIGHLKSMDVTEERSTKMRNKILSMAHEMNWTKPVGSKQLAVGKGASIDMEHVNNWMLSKSYLKKKLDDYTYTELPKLVTQFEEVYKSHLKKV
jgi:predicted ATP-grasp superfamily ATP-dependent carboligase